MTTPLERVRLLISLSASPNSEEARTSAFLACKLIREHGFVVGAKPADPKPEPAPRPAPTRSRRKGNNPWARPAPEKAQTDYTYTVGGDQWTEVVNIYRGPLMYGTHCRWCRKAMGPGVVGAYVNNRGAYHVECVDAALKSGRS